MDAERFEILAAAYGGDPRRWPVAEREAALAYQNAEGVGAERILFEARQLDAALDASPPAQVSHALRNAVLASAPEPLAERKAAGWLSGALFGEFGRGLMVASLSAAAVLGVAAGATVTQKVISEAQADAIIAEAGAPTLDEQEILG